MFSSFSRSFYFGRRFKPSPGGGEGGGSGIVTSNLVLNLDAADYSGIGNWLDASANGNDAVLQGSPNYNSSQQGYFDLVPGDGDWFSIADNSSLDNLSAISFEFWINIDNVSAAGPNMLFSKRTSTSIGYVGFFTTTGWTIRVGTASPTQLTYSSAPTTGVWQHVVATIGSGGSKFYINGSEVATSAYTGDFNNINTGANLDLFQVNPRPQTGPVTMDGKVSVVRIYSAVLTPEQILSNYNAVASRYA